MPMGMMILMIRRKNKFGSETISYSEARCILNYSKEHKFREHLCKWTVGKTEHGNYEIRCDVVWWFYILSFIPINIIALFAYIWNEGIKHFKPCERNIVYYVFVGNYDGSGKRAEEIYYKHICYEHIDKITI